MSVHVSSTSDFACALACVCDISVRLYANATDSNRRMRNNVDVCVYIGEAT